MSTLSPLIPQLQTLLVQASPSMPPLLWWLSLCTLLVLAVTAIIDAFTAIVPDLIIIPAMIITLLLQGFFGSWVLAGLHARYGLETYLVIWGLNRIWHYAFRRDALGMGDAKWTMLAVISFGFAPAMVAWGAGACLAVLWIGAAQLARYKIAMVTFAPFLFIGLCFGIYICRF